MEFRREAPGDASMGVAVAGVDSEFISMECIEVVAGVVAVLCASLCSVDGRQMANEVCKSDDAGEFSIAGVRLADNGAPSERICELRSLCECCRCSKFDWQQCRIKMINWD